MNIRMLQKKWILYRQFCLENIKDIIEKCYNLFQNDSDVILKKRNI